MCGLAWQFLVVRITYSLHPLTLIHCASLGWYQALKESNAVARAKLNHISYGRADQPVRNHYNGAYGAALKSLSQYRLYARLIAMKSSRRGRMFLLLDVNLGLWRKIQVARVPDTEAALEAQRIFREKNPGYMD